MVSCFFVHRDAPKEIKPTLKRVLVDLIENKNVDMFYVGNYGYARDFKELTQAQNKTVINIK